MSNVINSCTYFYEIDYSALDSLKERLFSSLPYLRLSLDGTWLIHKRKILRYFFKGEEEGGLKKSDKYFNLTVGKP